MHCTKISLKNCYNGDVVINMYILSFAIEWIVILGHCYACYIYVFFRVVCYNLKFEMLTKLNNDDYFFIDDI